MSNSGFRQCYCSHRCRLFPAICVARWGERSRWVESKASNPRKWRAPMDADRFQGPDGARYARYIYIYIYGSVETRRISGIIRIVLMICSYGCTYLFWFKFPGTIVIWPMLWLNFQFLHPCRWVVDHDKLGWTKMMEIVTSTSCIPCEIGKPTIYHSFSIAMFMYQRDPKGTWHCDLWWQQTGCVCLASPERCSSALFVDDCRGVFDPFADDYHRHSWEFIWSDQYDGRTEGFEDCSPPEN